MSPVFVILLCSLQYFYHSISGLDKIIIYVRFDLGVYKNAWNMLVNFVKQIFSFLICRSAKCSLHILASVIKELYVAIYKFIFSLKVSWKNMIDMTMVDVKWFEK
jgi:hypothetical protein